jgi:hypothetical protein
MPSHASQEDCPSIEKATAAPPVPNPCLDEQSATFPADPFAR